MRGIAPSATKGRRWLGLRLTLCVSRKNETLSRKENGAVHVGNMDLILPVRVRTCAENVGRTGSARQALWGCSQCVPAMDVTERPVNVTLQGGVSAEATCELPPCGRSMGSSPPAWSPEMDDTGILSGYFGAWRCHVETMAIHSDRMKSHAVSVWILGRASAIYKAMPKGRVTRRICEAVSGSTDLWDGSRA